jgi:hypothetical protein
MIPIKVKNDTNNVKSVRTDSGMGKILNTGIPPYRVIQENESLAIMLQERNQNLSSTILGLSLVTPLTVGKNGILDLNFLSA